jgi:hypothetical protein
MSFFLSAPNGASVDHSPALKSRQENCMKIEDSASQTFVERVLVLLEEKFPWLGKENDDPVSGADTVDELADLHRSLIDRHTADRKTPKT